MKWNNWLLLLVLVGFILYAVMELKCTGKNIGAYTEKNNQQWKTQNDFLVRENKNLNKKITLYKLIADSLRHVITTNRLMINQIKNKQHESIRAIDALTADELYAFFSEFETKADIGR